MLRGHGLQKNPDPTSSPQYFEISKALLFRPMFVLNTFVCPLKYNREKEVTMCNFIFFYVAIEWIILG
jgi:hypothetical protein